MAASELLEAARAAADFQKAPKMGEIIPCFVGVLVQLQLYHVDTYGFTVGCLKISLEPLQTFDQTARAEQ